MCSLLNKVIISTQPEQSYKELATPLELLGAKVINSPMIAFKEAEISISDFSLINNISQFNWLIFTSKNGVKYFFKIFNDIRGNYNLPKNLRIAVIGKKTGKELLNYGITPNYISESNLSEIFAKELKQHVIKKESKVLVLLGNLASTNIENELSGYVNIYRINCYETIKLNILEREVASLLKNNKYDLLVFTSSSALSYFLDVLSKNRIAFDGSKVVSIGISTTNTMNKYGIKPILTARQSNIEGLIEEIKLFFK